MNWYHGRYGAILGCTVAALGMMSQPAQAAQTEITNIELNPTASGFQLVIYTQGNQRPPIFTVNRGNNSVADINNAQLRLPDGKSFQKTDPAPGINYVEVRQLNDKTIRILVEGVDAAPLSDIVRRDSRQGLLVMQFDRNASANNAGVAGTGQQPASTSPRPNAVPPFQRRAVAPPVGDLAIAPLNVEPEKIELGSTRAIPKLLLRDAPVREVLTLLGRAANTNIAFAESGEEGGGPTISLDIENESVEDVFNYVLRLSGLEANRIGQTIFVGKDLPGDARNRIVRTIRLNQMKATAVVKTKQTLKTEAETGGNVSENDNRAATTANTAIERTKESEVTIEGKGAKEILESYGANAGGEVGATSSLLKGLEVVAETRTNTVTLIGTPRRVSIATALLTQLDVRQRQVAVNVKFVDVNLLKGKFANADLRYQVNNGLSVGVVQNPEPNRSETGFGIVTGSAAGIVDALSPTALLAGTLNSLTNNFLGALFTSISNNDAKILTNPTLLIQEGSSAQVNLTEQVFSGIEITAESEGTSSGAALTSTTQRPIIQNAGVILNVTVDRIDDNGFITLNVTPEVSSFSGRTFVDATGGVASLLQQRRLESGLLRLRDGQTLVLAGIIQDQDRVSISKVPILGDIPLLGRLFRSENNERQRSELVVLVTPQILSDSDQSTYGYQYNPGPEAEELLRR